MTIFAASDWPSAVPKLYSQVAGIGQRGNGALKNRET